MCSTQVKQFTEKIKEQERNIKKGRPIDSVSLLEDDAAGPS